MGQFLVGLCALPLWASADQIEETIVHGALKAFSYVVLGLMFLAIVFASYIAIKYWTGISV